MFKQAWTQYIVGGVNTSRMAGKCQKYIMTCITESMPPYAFGSTYSPFTSHGQNQTSLYYYHVLIHTPEEINYT